MMQAEEKSPEISPTISILEKDYDFIDDSSDEEEEEYNKLILNTSLRKSASSTSGTPLNIELAQLLKTEEDVGTFGISKNIETLEESTSELGLYEKKMQQNKFTKGSELFLRLDSEKSGSRDRTPCCSCKSSPFTPADHDGTEVFESGSFHISSPLNNSGFIEPNTSFHSLNGYDNEQVMFEGTYLILYANLSSFTILHQSQLDNYISCSFQC